LVVIVAACASSTARSGFAPDSTDTPASSSSSSSSSGALGNDAGLPDAEDQALCAGSITQLKPSGVFMLVIMDGSGSMNDPLVENGPTGLKWQAARDAMVSFINDVEAKNDPMFGLGLFLSTARLAFLTSRSPTLESRSSTANTPASSAAA
jgi:hypothetical protein